MDGASVRRSSGRAGAKWRRVSTRVRQRSTHCWLCLQPLAPDLRWPHPKSTTVHHIVSLAAGGAPLDEQNLAATHRVCNEIVGAKVVGPGHLAAGPADARGMNPSRRWRR